MWGRVNSKKTSSWLWHAINHDNGDVVAYVIGSRHHDMLWQLTDLIYSLNLNITAVYSDDNFAYHDVIPSHTLHTGKINTQKIERKHLSFRTRLKRLARKTICFSKSLSMHISYLDCLLMSLYLTVISSRTRPLIYCTLILYVNVFYTLRVCCFITSFIFFSKIIHAFFNR